MKSCILRVVCLLSFSPLPPGQRSVVFCSLGEQSPMHARAHSMFVLEGLNHSIHIPGTRKIHVSQRPWWPLVLSFLKTLLHPQLVGSDPSSPSNRCLSSTLEGVGCYQGLAILQQTLRTSQVTQSFKVISANSKGYRDLVEALAVRKH